MPRHRAPFSVVLCGALAGCASVDVLPVRSPDQPGIRYWRPAPYIALAPTVNAGVTSCEAKLVMLPDKSQEYAITMQAGIGTTEASPTLDGGWNLTSFTGKADSKTAENIGALANLVGSIGGAVKPGLAPVDGKPAPIDPAQQSILKNCTGLLKIVYDPVTRQITGFLPMSLHVNFAMKPPAAPAKPKGGDKKELNLNLTVAPAVVGVSPPLPTVPARGGAPAP